jgi:hypothetical protein
VQKAAKYFIYAGIRQAFFVRAGQEDMFAATLVNERLYHFIKIV